MHKRRLQWGDNNMSVLKSFFKIVIKLLVFIVFAYASILGFNYVKNLSVKSGIKTSDIFLKDVSSIYADNSEKRSFNMDDYYSQSKKITTVGSGVDKKVVLGLGVGANMTFKPDTEDNNYIIVNYNKISLNRVECITFLDYLSKKGDGDIYLEDELVYSNEEACVKPIKSLNFHIKYMVR